jgi:hypothetical protein
MKRILTSSVTGTVGQPFLAPSLSFLQDSYKEVVNALINGLITYTTNDVVVIYGCVISGAGPYAVTAGAIYYNGEIYLVDANASVTVSGGETLIWDIIQTFDGTIDPIAFSDSLTYSVHQISKIALQSGVSGSGIADYDAATVKYLNEWNSSTSTASVTASSGTITLCKRKWRYENNTLLLNYEVNIQLTGTYVNDIFSVTIPAPVAPILADPYNAASCILKYKASDATMSYQAGICETSGSTSIIITTAVSGLVNDQYFFRGQISYKF